MPGPAAVRILRSTAAIRERAAALLARARAGESDAFRVDDAALDHAAQTVAALTRERYPDGRIPYHSRWRHFEAGGVDRLGALNAALGALGALGDPGADPEAAARRARAHIDLVVVSVLLDAGAGADWRYVEDSSHPAYTRSEGLGVASFHAFTAGLFSSDPAEPLRADAAALQALDEARLAAAFQVRADNPLVGLAGRTALLRRLGEALAAQPAVFGPAGRPGGLFDAVASRPDPAAPAGRRVAAHDLLVALLDTLSDIWPAGQRLDGIALGDCWRHDAVAGDGASAGWMPFHKLSQWLTYSLLEPFEWAGVGVDGLDALTGLPEYRNGGLLIDTGVLQPQVPDWATRTWTPADAFIVEWRALTVALLDELAPRVRAQLGLDAQQMPLACVLEGGTWAAGRLMAQRLRQGLPPLIIDSDGTVF